MAILDETDSGLDIDALQVIAKGVNSLRSAERSVIMVTHYQRLLDYIVPDYVHVLSHGKIVRSGGKELALELEAIDKPLPVVNELDVMTTLLPVAVPSAIFNPLPEP